MTIQIEREHEQFVRELVAAGSFADEAAVIEEALSLLRSREELRAKIQVGIDELDRGERIPAEQVLAELRARAAKKLANG